MSSAYIIKSYPCIKAQLDYVNQLTEGLDWNTRHLFCHILASNLINPDRLAPIHCELIKDNLRGASWASLYTRNLINITSYSISENLSREYEVADSILIEYLQKGELCLELDLTEPRYNLINGRLNDKVLKSELYDNSRNKYPQLIVDAINIIKSSLFDLEAIPPHINDLKRAMDEAREKLLEKNPDKELEVLYREARGKYVNDLSCYKIIIAQKPIKLSDKVWTYPPVYRTQMSGRISHIGGGLQSCSRTMKHIATQTVDDLHNYDLKASQVNGLIQQFETAGLDVTWLENYRDNPNSKDIYAAKIAVSVDCWKQMLCSTIMGSFLPQTSKKTIQLLEEGSNLAAILSILSNEFKGDINKVINSLSAYRDAIAPLKKQLDLWHTWLVDSYVNAVAVRGKNGSLFITNPTGMKLNVTELKNSYPMWKVKSMVAAFILQGQEAAFIHHLTLLSLKYGYTVCANEHDGLITVGEIPPEAVTLAGDLSGLKYCVLLEKSFI